MGKEVLVLKIRNANGEIIGEIALEEPDGFASCTRAKPAHSKQQSTYEYDDSREFKPVTDAQKRMLFRLALKLGHQGDAAREFIESRLSAFGNGKPDCKTASYLIDKLQNEVKKADDNGGGRANAA
jgi:hypothetical protein